MSKIGIVSLLRFLIYYAILLSKIDVRIGDFSDDRRIYEWISTHDYSF